jgi:hypothetical protein
MRKGTFGMLVLALLVAVSANASAQLIRTDHPWAVRIGALWPTDSNVRDATDKTWFNAGLDYTLGETAEGNDWVGSLDYGNANNANYWAFQLLYMWRNNDPSSSNSTQFSFGVGGGMYILDPKNGGSQTEYGLPFVAEWDLSGPFFLQGKYHWVVSRNAASAFNATVGYRF